MCLYNFKSIHSFLWRYCKNVPICNQLIVNQSYSGTSTHIYHVIETFIFQAVEVKFTLSEFVTCYKRLMGLNLEGFSEFVNRTLEALISTSMMVHKTMTTDKRKCSHTNQVKIFENSQCCQLHTFFKLNELPLFRFLLVCIDLFPGSILSNLRPRWRLLKNRLVKIRRTWGCR